MPRLAPLDRNDLSPFETAFTLIEGAMGFVPRSLYTMGRWPELLEAFARLSGTLLGPGGQLDPELRALVSFVASRAAGCQYCQAHTAHTAHRAGASEAKLQAAFEYETSPLFDARERAALRLAHHASLVPNAAEEEHFEALRAEFDEREILEIVAVISLFGFLNRWNDTLATELEDAPRALAEATLGEQGWSVGKHG